MQHEEPNLYVRPDSQQEEPNLDLRESNCLVPSLLDEDEDDKVAAALSYLASSVVSPSLLENDNEEEAAASPGTCATMSGR